MRSLKSASSVPIALMRSMSIVGPVGGKRAILACGRARAVGCSAAGRTIGCQRKAPDVSAPSHAQRRYWTLVRRWSAILLGVWLVVTVGIAYSGPALDFDFFGWPFGFWAAAQGVLIVYVAIVAVYALVMNRLDRAGGDDAE